MLINNKLVDFIMHFFVLGEGATRVLFPLALTVIVFSVLIYYLVPGKLKNITLLLCSLLYIGIYQSGYLVFFVVFVLLNYYLGYLNQKYREDDKKRKISLWCSVIINLSILLTLKLASKISPQFGNPTNLYFFTNMNAAANWVVPIGLSYISFQVLSYQFDIFNRLIDREKNLIKFSVYLLMFPKLLSGPIERYKRISKSLGDRNASLNNFSEGLMRFIPGLAKKILIADTIAKVINPVFNLTDPYLTTGQAWFVLIGFAIQLYYDFSGITDMAIGLGKMLGFELMENFNYPYISKSISEFWRRWHISLSSWFRDYVFFPMEFASRRKKFPTQRFNILFVFALTGLWHGLTLNFLTWGFLMGFVIILESSLIGKALQKTWRPLQHIWTLGWVLLSWVFFRSPTLSFAWNFLRSLVGFQAKVINTPVYQTWPFPIIDNSVWIVLIIGIIFATPIIPFFGKILFSWKEQYPNYYKMLNVIKIVLMIFLFLVTVSYISSMGFIPSIYENF